MNSDSLTEQLKAHALSHGIDLIGITSAKPFVRRGKTEAVLDPKKLLDDARAVIVTAFYINEAINAPEIDKDDPPGRGRPGSEERNRSCPGPCLNLQGSPDFGGHYWSFAHNSFSTVSSSSTRSWERTIGTRPTFFSGKFLRRSNR